MLGKYYDWGHSTAAHRIHSEIGGSYKTIIGLHSEGEWVSEFLTYTYYLILFEGIAGKQPVDSIFMSEQV